MLFLLCNTTLLYKKWLQNLYLKNSPVCVFSPQLSCDKSEKFKVNYMICDNNMDCSHTSHESI